MPSDKAYLDFILEQLAALDGVSYRAMMGEYILYYRGRVIGGIYDNRFLVKPADACARLLPHARREQPYAGAKEMVLVDEVDRKDFLCRLVRAVGEELSAPRPKTRRTPRKKP